MENEREGVKKIEKRKWKKMYKMYKIKQNTHTHTHTHTHTKKKKKKKKKKNNNKPSFLNCFNTKTLDFLVLLIAKTDPYLVCDNILPFL